MEKKDRELGAINKSIRHWRSNVNALKKADTEGKKICQGDCEWFAERRVLGEYDSGTCELCSLYYDHPGENRCTGCPLVKYGYCCEEDFSPWLKVRNARGQKTIIRTAENMLRTLIEVREKHKKERR